MTTKQFCRMLGLVLGLATLAFASQAAPISFLDTFEDPAYTAANVTEPGPGWGVTGKYLSYPDPATPGNHVFRLTYAPAPVPPSGDAAFYVGMPYGCYDPTQPVRVSADVRLTLLQSPAPPAPASHSAWVGVYQGTEAQPNVAYNWVMAGITEMNQGRRYLVLTARATSSDPVYWSIEQELPGFDASVLHHLELQIDASGAKAILDGSLTLTGFVSLTSPPFSGGPIHPHFAFWTALYAPGTDDFDNFAYSATPMACSGLGALIDIAPDTLNVNSQGRWVTGYITPPSGLNVANIDVATVEITRISGDLLSTPIPADAEHGGQVGDYDEDQVPDLTVKFDRQALSSLLLAGDRTITIEGNMTVPAGVRFSGTDTIRVIEKGGGK